MTDILSPRERLLQVLKKEGTDRPPVICPGGMMNAAVIDVMEKRGHRLPEAHHDAALMESLVLDVEEETGFENFGIPFCMTIEPEALGSETDYGTLESEAKIRREAFPSAAEALRTLAAPAGKTGLIGQNPRAGAVLGSMYGLSKKHPDIPVTGCVSGAVSTAASLVDPLQFLKELRRDRENAHRLMEKVTDELVKWALLMVEAGAAVITIADPTATGEILGPRLFTEFTIPYTNRIADAVHAAGLPVIVHICGELRTVKEKLPLFHGDAISTDAMVNLGELREEAGGGLTVMGNLSTYLLDTGSENTVRSGTEALIRRKIDIIAPACGLSTSTPLKNLRAFTDTVRETHAPGKIPS